MATKDKLVTLEDLKAVYDVQEEEVGELKEDIDALEETCLYIDSDGYICLKEAE